ncbi:MAG: glutathione S-transferase family protein [Alphaproteobacteria bacterium]
MTMQLVIGNKRTSSWSMRPWIAMRHAGIAFQEAHVTLRQPDTRSQILRHSPAGHVPVLKHDGRLVWDSLAILEYAAELAPDAGLWPIARATRAEARAVSAEMHSGFMALRQEMPMDCTSTLTVAPSAEAQADIARIVQLWEDCRARHAGAGDFLFGGFTNADAMFAPVVSRFITYGVDLPPAAAAYRDAVSSLPAYRAWLDGAAAEA